MCFVIVALTVCWTAAAECLNGHSQAVKLKLDNDFEDWDFFADDFDKRVRGFVAFFGHYCVYVNVCVGVLCAF